MTRVTWITRMSGITDRDVKLSKVRTQESCNK